MNSIRDDDTLTIGALAAHFGLAPHVLRHWESMQLLTPAKRVNGRRRYNRGHYTRIAMIVRGKAAGMSLDQLREVFAAASPALRRDLLRRQHAELERRQRELEAAKVMVEHALTCEAEDLAQCPAFRRLVEALPVTTSTLAAKDCMQ
ncbi:MerR family transcriptional regulator [Amycolatopsis anabasis]|uniref:MerR family transcriptional regulator n=1 Tax=Amycolatopsis anabasis TaxID=1840409 RepID=UPI001C550E64|nr:MerR family transcriptional regulator [Amycolatopsis anabasis]